MSHKKFDFELLEEFYHIKRLLCKDVIKPSLGVTEDDLTKYLEFCYVMDTGFGKNSWNGVVLKSYIAFAFLKLRKLPVHQRAKLLPKDFFNGTNAAEFKKSNANAWISFRNSAVKMSGDNYFYFDITVASNFNLMEYEKASYRKLGRYVNCCMSNGGFMSTSRCCMICKFDEKYKYAEIFNNKHKEKDE